MTSGAGNCDPRHRSVASSQLETCVDQTCKQGFLTMFWSCYYSVLLRFIKVTDNRKLQLGVYPTILRERPLLKYLLSSKGLISIGDNLFKCQFSKDPSDSFKRRPW